MGLGEISLGEMGLGEMGLGEMGQNRVRWPRTSSYVNILALSTAYT